MYRNFDPSVLGIIFVLIFCNSVTCILCNPQLHDRIVGGVEASIEDYPYQVSLHYEHRHLCGGAIIDSKFILTAAHCVYRLNRVSMSVHVGNTINYYGEKHYIAAMKIHKYYDPQTSSYDIALLKLADNLTYKISIRPIPIPIQNEPVPTSIAVVTGWGHVKEGGAIERSLRKILIPIIDRKKCQLMYKDVGDVTDKMICAGMALGGKDSCQGDSGGPLVAKGKLIGVVSWGYGCARPYYPGIYTQVSKFSNWIKSEMLL